MSNRTSPTVIGGLYELDDDEFRQAIGPSLRDEIKFYEFIIKQSEDPSIPLEKIVFNLRNHTEQAGCFYDAYLKRVFEQDEKDHDQIDRDLRAAFDQAVTSAGNNPDTLRPLYAMRRLLRRLGWLK